MRFLLVLALVPVAFGYPFYQQQGNWNNSPYQIGTGVSPQLSSVWYNSPFQIGTGVRPVDQERPYNPYSGYFPYDWNTFSTDFYNPYNN